MSITINHATLARQVNGEIEYIYPKTTAELVEYDSDKNVKEKIDSIDTSIENINNNINNIDAANKVNKPIDENGNYFNGAPGQILESNGDGSTTWVSRAKIYVGTGPLPEGYDAKIDPNGANIKVDKTLLIDGMAADASATGKAINSTKEKIALDIETHNIDTAAHTDIRAMVTDAKDYILFKDIVTGDVYKVYVENGKLICDSTVAKCTGISITTAPTKTSYNVGDIFDSTGMVVIASYDDGTAKEVTNYTYSTVPLTGNESDITITYIEAGIAVTTTVSINVAIKCIGIDVITAPTKISYNIGEVFNPSGMVVIARYNNDTTKEITNYAYPTTPLVVGTSDIIITYTENDSSFTDTVSITVIAKCTGISITTAPTKTSYDVGDIFNPSGMIVIANYDNGATKEIINYEYPTTPLVAGTNTITITYTENDLIFTDAVSITVIAKCTGINITTAPTKASYYIGDIFNPAGMVVKAIYNDGTTKEITNYTYPTIALTAGINSITVTYIENNVTFTAMVPITVIAKCTGINITTMPTKTSYTDIESFNPSGMVVTATYNDNSTKSVTNYTYPTTTLTTGTTNITVTYVESGSTFTAIVPITVVKAFDANTILQDFTYINNNDGTYTITGWKGTLNGVPSTEVVIPDNSAIIVNPSDL